MSSRDGISSMKPSIHETATFFTNPITRFLFVCKIKILVFKSEEKNIQ